MNPPSYPQDSLGLRRLLQHEVRDLKKKPVTLMLSGGIDSNAVLLLLRDVGANVTCCSFTLDGHVSTDFSCARTNAKRLGYPFRGVLLPHDDFTLLKDVRTLIHQYGLRSKTAIECVWPFLYAFAGETNATVLTGRGADRLFGISKKAMIHCRHDVKKLDQFRNWRNSNTVQFETFDKISQGRFAIRSPFLARSIQDLFLGRDWDSINRPKKKQSIWDAFPELTALETRQPANLQLGDSGIAARFHRRAQSQGYRTPVSLYNAIAKER